MGFWNRLTATFSRPTAALKQHAVIDSISSLVAFEPSWDVELRRLRNMLPSTLDITARTAYRDNAAVYSVIRTLTTAFSEPELDVVIDGERAPEHPLRRLFSQPMERFSETQLWSRVAFHLCTGGNTYILKLRSRNGAVVGLRPIPEAAITRVSAGGVLQYYTITLATGASENIVLDDVIHVPFVLPDGSDESIGLCPLVPALLDVRTDSEATRYLYAVLKNDAVPRLVLQTDTQLSEKARALLKQSIEENYGGANRGRPMLLEEGLTASRISLSLQELALEQLRSVPEARICSVYGVPPELVGVNVGLTNSTYSNKREARRAFVENMLVPLWRYVADSIENGLRAEYGDEFQLAFNTAQVAALQENREIVEQRAITAYRGGVMTKNEARTALGLQPVPDGDQFFTSAALQSSSEQPAATETASNPAWQQKVLLSTSTASLPVCDGDGCAGEQCSEPCARNADYYDPVRVFQWKRYDTPAEAATERIARALQAPFSELEAEIVRRIERQKKSLDVEEALFDVEQFADALSAATEPELRAFVVEIARLAAGDVAANWDSLESEFFRRIPRVLAGAASQIRGVSATLRAQVREFLLAVAERPIEDIVRGLKDRFRTELGSPARLRRIARTASTAATSNTQSTVWKQAGIQRVQWVSMRDARVRPSHRAMDGTVIDIDGRFSLTDNDGTVSEGLPGTFPRASHSVNCRCTLAPVL